MEQQEFLMIEDVYEAMRKTAIAIAAFYKPGQTKAWSKIVGHMLFPSKNPEDAGKYFANCLDRERQEKLDPEQVLWLVKEGKRVGQHILMDFICSECEYAKPVPVEPKDELNDLVQRTEGIMKALGGYLDRIERVKDSMDGPFNMPHRPKVVGK